MLKIYLVWYQIKLLKTCKTNIFCRDSYVGIKSIKIHHWHELQKEIGELINIIIKSIQYKTTEKEYPGALFQTTTGYVSTLLLTECFNRLCLFFTAHILPLVVALQWQINSSWMQRKQTQSSVNSKTRKAQSKTITTSSKFKKFHLPENCTIKVALLGYKWGCGFGVWCSLVWFWHWGLKKERNLEKYLVK